MSKNILKISLLVALGLRLFELAQPQFWYDEAFSAWVARLPLDRMFQALAGDTHPPLYYLIIWPLVHWFGPGEWIVRLPSVIFGLAGIYLAWKLAQQLELPYWGQVAGLVAMVALPFQIHFSQETRMYTLLQLEILGLTLAVLNRRWVWVFICGLAALYTQNYGMFYLAVLWGIGVIRNWQDRRQILKLTAAMAGAGLLFLPWLAVIFNQMSLIQDNYWIQPVTPGTVLYAIYSLVWAFSMPQKLQPLAIAVVGGTLVLSIWRIRRFQNFWILTALSFGPLALAILAGLVWQPVLLFRGLTGSAPALYYWLGNALWGNSNRIKRVYACVLVVPFLVGGLLGQYMYNEEQKGFTREPVSRVREQWQEGDIIYHTGAGSAVTWGVYAADLPQLMMPECSPKDIGSLSDPTLDAMGIERIPIDELQAKRVWIIYGVGPLTRQCNVDRADQLIEHAQLIEMMQDDDFTTAGVYRYDRETVSQTKAAQ